jgi:Leucine-rich repeat (LRR) protein
LTIIGLDKVNAIESLLQPFSSTKPLGQLELSDLQLSALPTGLFAGVTIQRELRLSGRFLRDVERAFEGANLTELSVLGIDYTPVSQVCAALNTMPNLSTLRLRHTLLYEIPSCLSSLSSLSYIDLAHNGIQNLELDPFVHHAQLTILDLSHNFIATLTRPTKSYTLPLLSALSLRANFMSMFPPQLLEAMPNLLTLDISTNIITSLPTPLPISLLSLYAADNQLTQLPHDLVSSSLQILDVSSNRLDRLRYL